MIMKWKQLITILCVLLFITPNFSQDRNNEKGIKVNNNPNNQLKINFLPLIWNTYSLNYERKLAKRFTFGITGNYKPQGKPPLKNYIQKMFGELDQNYLNNEFDIDRLEYSTWSISPEFKYYLGKSGAFKGFYIAGFAKYESLNIIYDYALEIETSDRHYLVDIPLKGDLLAFTGGLYLGVQFKLNENCYIDWQIIGGNFGSGKLDVSVFQNLTTEEQEKIKEFALNIQEELSDINYDINEKGAKIWGAIPWVGLRTGLSLGYTF